MMWSAIVGRWLLALLIVTGACLLILTLSMGSGRAQPATESTPSADPTVTALERERLALEVDHLRTENSWWRKSIDAIVDLISVVGPVGVGLYALYGFFSDREAARTQEFSEAQQRRKDEQEKYEQRLTAERVEAERRRDAERAEQDRRAQERFLAVVEGLGHADSSRQAGAAVMLRSFLRPGYEDYHLQAFDLAAAYLRLQPPPPDPGSPPSAFTSALAAAFKEALPLARAQLREMQQANTREQKPDFRDPNQRGHEVHLDASRVHLEGTFLHEADLAEVGMLGAYLTQAYLRFSDLSDATLQEADLQWANLNNATLDRTDLRRAKLGNATLIGARALKGLDLRGAVLSRAKLTGASLWDAQLQGAKLDGAMLRQAHFTNSNLSNVDLTGADLSEVEFWSVDFTGSNVQDSVSLQGATFRGVTGLSAEQIKACVQAGGAFQ